MKALIIISSIIVGIISFIMIINYLITLYRKSTFKQWEVGDTIETLNGNSYKLIGWSTTKIYVDANGKVGELSWGNYRRNISNDWRDKWDECKKDMNKEPAFIRDTPFKDNKSDGTTYYGISIEMMSEIECDTYLKLAIEEQQYDIAAKIRDRRKSFR